MNIFVLDTNPNEAARQACDKHIVKMILESAQMLCTAHTEGAPYKATHKKHPCTLWVSASKSNYLWLCEHGLGLCAEYTKRYQKTHKTESIIKWCMENVPCLPDIGLTEFAQAMPDKYKVKGDAVKAYRNYYNGEKARIAKWKDGNVPTWFTGVFE